MIILNAFIFVFLIIIFFFRNRYIWELIISFLPYIMWFISLICIAWIFVIIRNVFFIDWWSFLNCKFWILFLIAFSVLWWLYAYEYFSFYNHNINQAINTEDSIKVMYANIYSRNEEYESLKNKIENEDPDIALFVEFWEIHEEYLLTYINENLKNIGEYERIRLAKGTMALTKLKIENIWINNEDLLREYWYFKTVKNKKPYYFYVIHTSSPISNYYFEVRNKQLEHVSKTVKSNHKNLKDNIIVLWDFNTTPWSAYYKSFEKWFNWKLVNITRDRPIITWDLWEMVKINDKRFWIIPEWIRNIISYIPLYCHIDQIFVSKSIKVWDLRKIHIDWSDHYGFVVKIGV